MKSSFNNLVIYNGYPLSVIIAVTFHSFILTILIWLQSSPNIESLELVQPTIVKALFIDENPQVRNRRILERQRVEQLEQERIEQEAQRQQEEEEALERQAELERRQQEEEQERSALREREELEEQRQLEQQRERALAQEEERKQREFEAERRRVDQEAERRRQEAIAAEGARTEFELIQSATAVIQSAVQQVWNRPPSARNGMRAILQIQMLPTGELLDARIIESSGDPAFDRSAENAVFGAAPFTELSNLPINIFNSNFRTLSLIFQPEDLLN